jgi:hypothetical protein
MCPVKQGEGFGFDFNKEKKYKKGLMYSRKDAGA